MVSAVLFFQFMQIERIAGLGREKRRLFPEELEQEFEGNKKEEKENGAGWKGCCAMCFMDHLWERDGKEGAFVQVIS